MSTQNTPSGRIESDRLKILVKAAAGSRRDRKERCDGEGNNRVTFAAFVQDHPGMAPIDHLTAPSIIIDHHGPTPDTGGEAVVRIRLIPGPDHEEITTCWAADMARDIAHALRDVADHTETLTHQAQGAPS